MSAPTGKFAVAAHGHGIAVLRDAAIGEPVGRVAQLAAVNDVLLLSASPHPVVALGQEIEVRDPPFQHKLPLVVLPGRAHPVDADPVDRICGLVHHAVKQFSAGPVGDESGSRVEAGQQDRHPDALGAQGRIVPRRKVSAAAVFGLGAAVRFIQTAEGPPTLRGTRTGFQMRQ